MEQDLVLLIGKFLLTTEYANTKIPMFKIVLTDNIYDYVLQDDSEYAKRINADTIHGLYYVSQMGEQQLVIEKTTNSVEIAHNLFHETIHFYDFNFLARYKNNYKMRELQNDIFFILWSEFHAEYYSYKYLIESAKENINPKNIQNELITELDDFLNQSTRIEIQVVADFCVRLYGQYIALYDAFKNDVDKYPSNFFINIDFLGAYDYLNEHKTFEKIKDNLEELKMVFKKLESHTR